MKSKDKNHLIFKGFLGPTEVMTSIFDIKARKNQDFSKLCAKYGFQVQVDLDNAQIMIILD